MADEVGIDIEATPPVTPAEEEADFSRTPLKKSVRFNPFQVDYANKEIVVQPSSINTRLDLSMNNAKGGGGAYLGRHVDFTSTDATPTVANANVFETAGTTTITDFDDGTIGQVIFIKATAAITITDNAAIILNNSENFVMANGDTLTLAMFDDQVWHELARNVAGATGTYGHMGQDNVPTTIAQSGSSAVIDGMTGGSENNVTFQNSKELKVSTAGIYLVVYSVSFSIVSGSNKEVEGRIGINDSEQTLGSVHRKIGTGSDEGAMGGNCVFSLSANDRISIMVENTTDSVDIVVGHANMSLIRVG